MKKIFSLLFGFFFLFGGLCSCQSEEAKEREERKKQILQYRANKTAVFQDENALYDDYQVDVAFLGDSLTDLYEVKTHFPQYLVSNRGIGGDMTVDLEERLQVSVYDLKPKVAVMLIGANNLETMFYNYETILQGFQKHLPNTKILLLSLTPTNGQFADRNQLIAYNNVKVKGLAEKYSYGFVDLYYPLFNIETGECFSEYTVDGLHFSNIGYQVITQKITPEIERQLSLWTAENE